MAARKARLRGDTKTKHVAWRLFLSSHAFVRKRIDEELQHAGLISFDDHDVLMALHEAPDERLRMSDLAEAALLSNSGITRRVAALEKRGYLERAQSPTDGRSTHAVLTRKGRRALDDAWPVYRAAIERYFAASLSAEEAELLSRVFHQLLTRIAGPRHQYLYQQQVTEEP